MSGVDRRIVMKGAAAGVVSRARDATPFHGYLVGGRREETLAEAADHPALGPHTGAVPTGARVHGLARNPACGLGRTVRGHLRSAYTGHCPGAGTRRVPVPRLTTPTR
ncbi:hypothetical protein J2X68_007028 [Streptomyces sp. 3330]|uniref:hypothetical protein n=1 Tax=Streptomyces sp. 3330 TaxID=2817755 RepID=UPI002854DF67|nr:hypothetical protein [Streptomyces sp. 3330]MDR6980290.1 hypothetical protein [Streptomyces sp. 3330]